MGDQDADGHRRQRTQVQDNNTWPASPAKGARERSSIRTTGKQMPCQVSEHPSGPPHKAPTDSTLGSTSHQCSSGMRAPKDPLKWVAHYRSQGWRKDLDFVFKAYYRYNFSSFKESEWSKLWDKVLDHLLPHQDEWGSIKENNPLQYMPYIANSFFLLIMQTALLYITYCLPLSCRPRCALLRGMFVRGFAHRDLC